MEAQESKIEKLIIQCKSNDVDIKVDGLTKLQAEIEAGTEISDSDALFNILKSCLRTSNQHLTNATLSILPIVLPILLSHSLNTPSTVTSIPSTSSYISPSAFIDVMMLRQMLTSFLPPGGLLDRLGDKEKSQVNARESLVLLGGFAYRAGLLSVRSKDGKGTETPMLMFERFLKECGLTSKVWKVREQSLLTLVNIRRAHHQFPIRPYLTPLVECLEDTDAHVRECARVSIVELFCDPSVNDAARADLKKELTKKGVRKAIADSVLSKVLSGSNTNSVSTINPQSREGSENGDATGSKSKDYVPPSLELQGKTSIMTIHSNVNTRVVSQSFESNANGSRPSSRVALASSVIDHHYVQPAYIASSRDLENEFTAMAKCFEGKETEHNWAGREKAIMRVRSMLKGDVHLRYADTFMASLRDCFIQLSLKTLASLRTTVSTCTCSLYVELAQALGTSMDPFCDILFTNLLKMAGFTKKITAQQSQATVTALITYTSTHPRTILPLLWNTLQEKTVQARAFAIAHLKQYIEVHGHRSKHTLENSGGLENLERSLKKALADPNPAVRETARVLYWVFEAVWHDRGLVILEGLEPLARRQLEKHAGLNAVLPPETPRATKKSSVASAIAASRAKAKAIASAPPTLRHQATSTSSAHTPALRGVRSPSTSPSSSVQRPATPLRKSTSPDLRASSRTTVPRSASAGSIPAGFRNRVPSATVLRSHSPYLSDQSNSSRRVSSPLVNNAASSPTRSSIIGKAITTALPVSSPSSSAKYATPKTRGHPVPVLFRQSTLFPELVKDNDESFLLAQTVPIPEGDSDLEDDKSLNLMSFSAPYEMIPPLMSSSKPDQESRRSIDFANPISMDSKNDFRNERTVLDEDSLRVNVNHTENVDDGLLMFIKPKDMSIQQPVLSPSINGKTNGLTASKALHSSIFGDSRQPATPVNKKNAAIMRQAAMFQDSPAYNSRQSSLLEIFRGQKHATGWWLKRQTLLAQPVQPLGTPSELEGYIVSFEGGESDKVLLQQIARVCTDNSVTAMGSPSLYEDPSSPSPLKSSQSSPLLHTDIWEQNKTFERLFNTLMAFLISHQIEEEIEYALIIVWEILHNQALYLEGREADLFSALLQVRYCNKINVLEASCAIRDALTSMVEPVYGLTTMHANLRAFHSEKAPTVECEEIKAATYAFGLIALGKFILRLPAEIAEEELPRLKSTLISALNDKSSLIVRESAAACIIAVQLVLRNETHLFELLDGLTDDKKNLLTYLFDKHNVRGLSMADTSGISRLQKEIWRLDTRTSTPSRSSN